MYYIQLLVGAFLEWSGNSRTLSQYLVNFTLCVTRHKMRQIAKGFSRPMRLFSYSTYSYGARSTHICDVTHISKKIDQQMWYIFKCRVQSRAVSGRNFFDTKANIVVLCYPTTQISDQSFKSFVDFCISMVLFILKIIAVVSQRPVRSVCCEKST